MAVLRILDQGDSDLLFKWINDPEVVRFNAKYHPVQRVQHDVWFAAVNENSDVLYRMIQDPLSFQTVGSCQLLRDSSSAKTAELRIRIGEKASWGKGIGSEAVRELMQLGFTSNFCESVYLWVRSDNERAIKSYQKNGFVAVDMKSDVAFDDNEAVDLLLMQINRNGSLPIGEFQIKAALNSIIGLDLKSRPDLRTKKSAEKANEGIRTLIYKLESLLPWQLIWFFQRLVLVSPRLAYFLLKKSGVHHRAI
jgi:RimJ/RimL family protein N-acetyltransferase